MKLHYFIRNSHGKCIEVSTNMSGRFSNGELAFDDILREFKMKKGNKITMAWIMSC